MFLKEIAGILAGILGTIAFLPYIRSILNGKTKPHRTTFLIWTIVDIVLLASSFVAGARETLWLVLAYSIAVSIVFLLSIKRGVGGFSRLDVACLALAIISIVLWIATNDARLAVCLNVLAEFLAYVPTIKKSYLYPETENRMSWTIDLIAIIFNVLAIRALKIEIALYPVTLLILQAVVVVLLWRPQPVQKTL